MRAREAFPKVIHQFASKVKGKQKLSTIRYKLDYIVIGSK